MSWQKKPISAPLLSGLEELATSIGGITEPVITLLDAANTALSVLQNFVVSNPNTTTALASALIDEVEKLSNDTFGAGVFQIIVQPYDFSGKFKIPGVGSLSSIDTASKFIEIEQTGTTLGVDKFGLAKLTPSKLIEKITQSFDDRGDAERPQFSDSATVTAFGFMITAPTIAEFTPIMEAFLAVWDFGEFSKLLKDLKSATNEDTGGDALPQSKKPNWDKIGLNSVTLLAETQVELNKQIAFLRGLIGSADDLVGDFLKLIESKINNLKAVVEDFNTLILKIKNSVSASGIYLLDVPPAIGGNTYLKDAIRDVQFSESNNQISAAVIYVGGGASLVPINSIRTLLS